MIRNSAIYGGCRSLKPLFTSMVLVLVYNSNWAQHDTVQKASTGTPANLQYYHSFTAANPPRTYTKVNYSRPNNQLMSWPNYPLTAAQIEQRDKQWEQDNKLSNTIARDIITSILSKKKKVAVIPKF